MGLKLRANALKSLLFTGVRQITFLFCLCSYKYTLAELNPYFQLVTSRAESYDDWASKVNKILKADQNHKSGMLLLQYS